MKVLDGMQKLRRQICICNLVRLRPITYGFSDAQDGVQPESVHFLSLYVVSKELQHACLLTQPGHPL